MPADASARGWAVAACQTFRADMRTDCRMVASASPPARFVTGLSRSCKTALEPVAAQLLARRASMIAAAAALKVRTLTLQPYPRGRDQALILRSRYRPRCAWAILVLLGISSSLAQCSALQCPASGESDTTANTAAYHDMARSSILLAFRWIPMNVGIAAA